MKMLSNLPDARKATYTIDGLHGIPWALLTAPLEITHNCTISSLC